MLETGQPWNLFGYDLSRAVHYVRAGWSDFLWGDDSPVLPAIDEIVPAHLENGETRYYRAGRQVPAPPDARGLSEAVVLPEHLALARTLSFPLAAEADLPAVIALEVNASSPFPESDTCFGWTVIARDDSNLRVCLVISSRSAVMSHIAGRLDTHDVEAYEVWALVEDRVVPLSGFGEARRQRANRRRLRRMVLTSIYCLAVIVGLFAAAAGFKYLELEKVRDLEAAVERSAGDAVGLREKLTLAREMIDVAAGYAALYPSPHRELKRLSEILGDGTWLTSVEVRGGTIRIEGQSQNAPTVMQQLLDDPAYASVEAPVAFRKGRSGTERFVLDLTLAGVDAAE